MNVIYGSSDEEDIEVEVLRPSLKKPFEASHTNSSSLIFPPPLCKLFTIRRLKKTAFENLISLTIHN